MAIVYQNITGALVNGNTANVNGVGTFSVQQQPTSSYGFSASAYNGTTYFASDNLGVHNSYASLKLNITSVGASNGISIKISYIVSAETNYDYGIFSETGTTLTGSPTYSTTGVYAHTRGQSTMSPVDIVYNNITSPTFIHILFRKDTSQSQGIDRMMFTVHVGAEEGSGGGGSDIQHNYFYWIGARVLPNGKRKNDGTSSGTYSLPTANLQYFTAELAQYQAVVSNTECAVIQYNGYKLVYTSGWCETNIFNYGSSPYTTSAYFDFDGVDGHAERTSVDTTVKLYTGTTQQFLNATSVLGSFTISNVTFYQNSFKVHVKTNTSSSLNKAYYNVIYPSPISATYKTGKNGYVNVITSAVNSTVTVNVTRPGSYQDTATVTKNVECVVTPSPNDNKIITIEDLEVHDSSLANSYSSENYLCLKYDSAIFDTASTVAATSRLMKRHDFLYFANTASYFKDDFYESQNTGTTGGYTVAVGPNASTVTYNLTGLANSITATIRFYAVKGDGTETTLLSANGITLNNSTMTFLLNVGSTNVTNVVQIGASVTASLPSSSRRATFRFTIGDDNVMLTPIVSRNGAMAATLSLSDDIIISTISLAITIT